MMKIYIVLALAAVMFRAIDDAVLLQNVMHIPSFMRKPMLLFWFQYIMSVSYIFERKQTNDAASKMEAKKINWLDNNSSDNNSSRYIFFLFLSCWSLFCYSFRWFWHLFEDHDLMLEWENIWLLAGEPKYPFAIRGSVTLFMNFVPSGRKCNQK